MFFANLCLQRKCRSIISSLSLNGREKDASTFFIFVYYYCMQGCQLQFSRLELNVQKLHYLNLLSYQLQKKEDTCNLFYYFYHTNRQQLLSGKGEKGMGSMKFAFSLSVIKGGGGGGDCLNTHTHTHSACVHCSATQHCKWPLPLTKKASVTECLGVCRQAGKMSLPIGKRGSKWNCTERLPSHWGSSSSSPLAHSNHETFEKRPSLFLVVQYVGTSCQTRPLPLFLSLLLQLNPQLIVGPIKVGAAATLSLGNLTIWWLQEERATIKFVQSQVKSREKTQDCRNKCTTRYY